MSGVITPILDTLLHEVLGKRVETQTHRELFEPVKPLLPRQAARAVHSDSRLNAEQATIQRKAGSDGVPSRSDPHQPLPLTPASTRTHFSPAARSIADILVKFPAPPSVLRSAAPLVSGQEPADAAQLASRLRQSIETSGLFYESHLARWYRGELPRPALMREPQMQLFLQRHLALNPGVGQAGQAQGMAATGAESSIPGALGRSQGPPSVPLVPVSAPSPPAPLAPGVQSPGQLADMAGFSWRPADQAEVPVESLRAMQAGSMEALDDTLQGLVRHQLELLVTPTLRWEGDLWAGVFMALVIHVPEVLSERDGEGSGQAGQDEDDEAVWYSELSLSLPRLGEMNVHLHLRGASLSLTLESESDTYLDELRTESGSLEERLARCGFDDVRVSIVPRRDETGAGRT